MERTEMIETARTLATTMDSLATLLDGEVKSIYSAPNSEMEGIYRQKTLLLAEYTAALSALKAHDTGRQPDLPADVSAALKSNATRLADSMKRNKIALHAAREASEKVVNVIIDAVRQQRHTGAAYGVGKDGEMIVATPSAATAQAVTFDTRL